MADDADTRRLKDFGGTVLFLLLQSFVWRAALFLTAGSVRGLVYVGLVLLFVTITVSVWRVARRRPAAFVALGGVVAQVVIGGIALLLAS
ncbi:hypothetical protein ACQI4F_10120 [Mycolicibacterium vaccae]|uniref:hypothetical protein n=1 Tax=Mycolicibacterium vaccae TaxID=1810 RepID=UPI003CEA8ADB